MVNDNTEGLKVAHYGNYINLNNARFLTGDCGISRSESEVDLTTEGILLFLLDEIQGNLAKGNPPSHPWFAHLLYAILSPIRFVAIYVFCVNC